MMDIDHFKDLNDRYGHQAGDLMLEELGKLLRKSSRQGDIACRYGGEEFVVVMPGASLENARQRAEYWRQSFYALQIPYELHNLHATLSIGVAVFPVHGVSADEVLNAADRAMYMAKSRGRNCVVAWGGGNADV
jgi:diguanylate cyclase (GGDEF)-like protein